MSASLAPGRIPRGTARIVAFDTNAYRTLAQDRSLAESIAEASEIRNAESKHSGFAIASPIVAVELIAHLDDVGDPAREVCMRALAALGEHARDAPDRGVRLFGWTEDMISHAIFAAGIPRAAKMVGDISALVAHVRDNAPSVTEPAAIANISAWASFVRNSESDWAASLAAACGVSATPADGIVSVAKGDAAAQKQLREFLRGEGFRDSWSRIEVEDVIRLLGLTLSEADRAEAVDRFKDAFSVPLKLQAELLAKLASRDGIALLNPRRKWANHIWDSAISFLVGKNAFIEGVPIELVTGDRAFKDAADSVGCGDRVRTLGDYLASIGIKQS